jgi:hypothetical protein
MSLRPSLIRLSIAAKAFAQQVNEEPGYALRL